MNRCLPLRKMKNTTHNSLNASKIHSTPSSPPELRDSEKKTHITLLMVKKTKPQLQASRLLSCLNLEKATLSCIQFWPNKLEIDHLELDQLFQAVVLMRSQLLNQKPKPKLSQKQMEVTKMTSDRNIMKKQNLFKP